jgi:20S proteasome alpha/beta subunit
MTVALSVMNDNGIVIAADGVGSFGIIAGSQQISRKKLNAIADGCAVAGSGISASRRRLWAC